MRADVRGEVRSAADLPLTGARLNGRELPADALEQDAKDRTLWRVVARDESLKVGDNAFELLTRNADGASLKPATLKLNVKPPEVPPPPKPVVRIQGPMESKTLDPVFKLAFAVESAGRLKRIEVVDGEGRLVYAVPEPEKLKPGEKDRYEVKPVDVTLERGNNLLRVRAVNDGVGSRMRI